ncbi:MAG: hypothetical protein BGN88_10840, partial [Clostridiales bacterium 43-6]
MLRTTCKVSALLISSILIALIAFGFPVPTRVQADVLTINDYKNTLSLAWSDEFNGTALDKSVWKYEGSGTHRNNELQVYCDTDAEGNVYLQDGSLVIEARKETRSGYDYTSGSICSKDLKTFRYGAIEMRAKIPSGKGLWPAFWMLGVDANGNKIWPNTGELDIMENIGSEPSKIYGTIHAANSSNQPISESWYYNHPTSLATDYHTYGVMWNEETITWYMDNTVYYTTETDEEFSVFDQNYFYLLLNLAVGGTWPGSPNSSTVFPSKYYVDYVRVYQTTTPQLASKTNNSITVTPRTGYEYSLDKNTWQASNVFSGLNSSTVYTVYQRKSATDLFPRSAISQGLAVTTSGSGSTTATTTTSPPTTTTAPVSSGQTRVIQNWENQNGNTGRNIVGINNGDTSIWNTGFLATAIPNRAPGSSVGVQGTWTATNTDKSQVQITLPSGWASGTTGLKLWLGTSKASQSVEIRFSNGVIYTVNVTSTGGWYTINWADKNKTATTLSSATTVTLWYYQANPGCVMYFDDILANL